MAGESILIIEDSMIVSTHIQSLLEQEGYVISNVLTSGEDAIREVEQNQPDLILMDIILAGEITGIEAASAILARQKVPIIYLTAMTDKKTIESAKTTGPYSYVIKPFDEKDLVTRIEMTLYKSKLEIESERQRLAILIEGQEMERQRVSRDLHDGLGQLLTAAKMNVDNPGFSDNAELQKKTSAMIHDAADEIRRISDNMMPSNISNFDLKTCVSSLCRQFQSKNVEVIFQTQQASIDVAMNEKLMLYRIAQECLTNAIRHGKASKVFIQLYFNEPNVLLTIEDNGTGFDEQLISHGKGLKNIAYRAQVLKAKLAVESQLGKGTMVSVSAPVNQTI